MADSARFRNNVVDCNMGEVMALEKLKTHVEALGG